MCELCLSTPCRPGCPNAPDTDPGRKQIYTCSACGGPVYEGERYIDACGVILCEFCCGAYTYTAYGDDYYAEI